VSMVSKINLNKIRSENMSITCCKTEKNCVTNNNLMMVL
jgi:hypothetical protein